MDVTRRRRHLVSSILALVLAAESVSVVAAAAQVTAAGRAVRPGPAPAASVAARISAGTATTSASPRRPDAPTLEPGGATPGPAAPAAAGEAAPKPAAATTIRYAGRNHVWIPSLGIDRSVSAFPCDRSRPPDNLVYRWGCAGANNVYLLGHAYSVFKPLHDAYVAGRLGAGMKAWYADGSGRVHVYAVAWWKVTLPTTGASWAWATQSRPSMTLQTCVGANSEYRLMVRLVEVAG